MHTHISIIQKMGLKKIMDPRASLEKISKKLRIFFQNLGPSDVVSVYLFGSRVNGPHFESSDLDVGILMREGYQLTNDALFTFMADIETLTQPLIPDIKILNELPVRVQHSILKNARQIFCTDDIADANFREQLYQKYFDLKPILQVFYDALLGAGQKWQKSIRKWSRVDSCNWGNTGRY
jgi:predicted nucleotidyltransferase